MLKLNPEVSSLQLNLFAEIQTLNAQLEAGITDTEIKTEGDFHMLVGKIVASMININKWSEFARDVEALMGTAYVHNMALPPKQRFHLDWWGVVSQKLLHLLAVVVAHGFALKHGVTRSIFWAIDHCLVSINVAEAVVREQDQMIKKINTFLNTPHT